MTRIFVIVILFFFIAVGLATGAVIGYIQTSDSLTPDDLVLKGFTTNIYDFKGQLVSPLHGDKDREMVDISVIPKHLRYAFVAIEDRRFYDHPGIDIKRIAGAVLNYIKPSGNDAHGASTITQQVVKNLTGQTERTLKRKVQEQWKALELERHLTKDQILELYMNIIYMGHNCYGVQSASKVYYGKDVSKLSLAESAALAGITNLPASYDPFTKKGRENIKKRQEIILAEMLKSEFIKKDEYDNAMNEVLKYNENMKIPTLNTSVQSYFVDQVVLDVKKALIEHGYSEDLALKMIYNNGLKIYSTMDSSVQKVIDETFINEAQYFSVVQKGQKPQGAMVILDAKNGQVRGLYGGSGPKTSGKFFNRASASDMLRQPGSTFKPIAVYAPAIDQKVITAGTVIDDIPVYLNGADKGRYPSNYDFTYSGLTTIRTALKQSLNVVSAKLWVTKNIPSFTFSYLTKMQINRENESYVSTSLGGLNKGVNPLQMAASYVPFVNKGAYYEPITFTRVEDSKGKVILKNKIEPKFVYEDETAYIMTSLLSGVVESGGTASPYGKILEGKIPTAGKTGTTSSNTDKWFVGFSPYFVGSTWYGYDSQKTTLIPSEYNRALILWRDVMEKIHKNLPPAQFNSEPSSIIHKSICKYSGKTPSILCSKDPRGSAVIDEIFIRGTEPDDSDICDVHVSAKMCSEGKDGIGRNQLFGANCPPSTAVENIWIKRTTPFVPSRSDDPYPLDFKYELPDSYCNVHGPGGVDLRTIPSTVSTPQSINTEISDFVDVTPTPTTVDDNLSDEPLE
jgi:penicillin-binding protein 1A